MDLTPKEYEILHCLALNAGRVVPHERVLAFAWGSNALESDVDQLKVHVRHLREKLERNPSAPEYLTTVRGVGYKLAVPRQTFAGLTLRGLAAGGVSAGDRVRLSRRAAR